MRTSEALSVLGLQAPSEPGSNGLPSLPVIRKAYKRAALASHPDKGGDAATFQRVGQAYKVLTEGEAIDGAFPFDFSNMDAAFDLFSEMMDSVMQSGILDELDGLLQGLYAETNGAKAKTRTKKKAPPKMGGLADAPIEDLLARMMVADDDDELYYSFSDSSFDSASSDESHIAMRIATCKHRRINRADAGAGTLT